MHDFVKIKEQVLIVSIKDGETKEKIQNIDTLEINRTIYRSE